MARRFPLATTSPAPPTTPSPSLPNSSPKHVSSGPRRSTPSPNGCSAPNEIDRYSIGDRTPGIHHQDDGSLTLYVHHERPADPSQAANWLPSPSGPFTVIIRAYGSDTTIADGDYRLPPITPH
jgi:hypothetical protein